MNPGASSPTDTSDREILSTRIIAAPRDRVFAAHRDPDLLAQWWGPNGFRNTFQVFEFRSGGQWRLVMHGPDGKNYDNEFLFEEIVEPEWIVIDHVSNPKFHLFISLEDKGGKTAVTWRQRFDSVEVFAAVQAICTEANQQNFDRLEAVLGLRN